LKKRRRQQSLEGLPIKESPSETVSGEDEDSGDDDTGSQYDTVTFLAHLPDVWPLLEPVGGSTSQASREVSAPVEGEGEPAEGRARAGPSERGATSPGVPQGRSVAPLPQARSPRTQPAGGATASASEARALSTGIRTRGQIASSVQRSSDAPSARAPRSTWPTGGSTEGPSQVPSGGSGLSGSRPLVPISG
jgi:hypothetical protein